MLKAHSAPDSAVIEADMLIYFFRIFPSNDENYGLAHYDFEFDNGFCNNCVKELRVIDFDDCIYHWYAMDVERATEQHKGGISSCVPCKGPGFLAGYSTEKKLWEDTGDMFALLNRYAIYSYARCLRSFNEIWHNEPKWMASLRKASDLYAEASKEIWN